MYSKDFSMSQPLRRGCNPLCWFWREFKTAHNAQPCITIHAHTVPSQSLVFSNTLCPPTCFDWTNVVNPLSYPWQHCSGLRSTLVNIWDPFHWSHTLCTQGNLRHYGQNQQNILRESYVCWKILDLGLGQSVWISTTPGEVACVGQLPLSLLLKSCQSIS